MRVNLLNYNRVTVARLHRGAPLLPLALLTVVMVVSWMPLSARGRAARREPLYTVAQLSTYLTAQPGQWVGRVVQVRAVAVVVPQWLSHGSLPFKRMVPRLVDPAGGGDLPGDLALVCGPEDRVFGALRRVPLLGRLLPPPQVLVWTRPTIYRIRLEVARDPGDAPYAAVLLDTHDD